MTKYKYPSCVRLVEELLEAQLICENGVGESSGGRKPFLYTIHSNYRYVIGVAIAQGYTRVVLLNLNLDVLHERVLKMDANCTAAMTLQFIVSEIEWILTERIASSELLGIGIAAAGSLDTKAGIIQSNLYLTDDWAHVRIAEQLQHRFNTMVKLNNGSVLAALGEYRKNYWKDTDSLAYTVSGFSLRCGMIANGQLLRNNGYMEDSFGHTVIDIHGPQCQCGAFGCLETYASIPAIRSEVVKRIKQGEASLVTDMADPIERVHMEEILHAVEQGDRLCRDVVEKAASYYGIGISNLVFMNHIDTVIIGGFMASHPFLYDTVVQTARQRLLHYPKCHVTFSKPQSTYNGAAIGAGCMIVDHFIL
ncbi:ROK family protein [Paenibacillus solanacearum]|nr:ROK family protein [Paenibacillus solanacearum]